MKFFGWFFCLALCAVLASGLQAEVVWHGYLMHHSAFKTAAPNNTLMLRNRLRLESEVGRESVFGKASADFTEDLDGSGAPRITLRELYLDIYGDWLDLRLGKQQVVWGKADGYFINDIVNALDLTWFLMQDFDDIRRATTMLNTKLHRGNHSLVFLAIPDFKPTIVGYSGDWGFDKPDSVTFLLGPVPLTIPIDYQDDQQPRGSLRSMEYGAKFNTFLFGTDLSLIYLKIHERKPVIHKSLHYEGMLPTGIGVALGHPWVRFFGFNFARPAGLFVIRGEGGYYPERWFDSNDASAMSQGMRVRKPFWQAMLAVDYQLTGNIDAGIQLIREQIGGYESGLVAEEVNSLYSLLVRARWRNDTILPYWLTLYNATSESYLSRFSVDWKSADNFTVTFGADFLGGEKESAYGQFNFGQFSGNDHVYLKVTYNF